MNRFLKVLLILTGCFQIGYGFYVIVDGIQSPLSVWENNLMMLSQSEKPLPYFSEIIHRLEGYWPPTIYSGIIVVILASFMRTSDR